MSLEVHSPDSLSEHADDSEDERLYANPLRLNSRQDIIQQARKFAKSENLNEDLFVKGALLIRYPGNYDQIDGLTLKEKKILDREKKSPLSNQTWTLYFTIFLASIAAAIQGWDQTGTNGANLIWPNDLGLKRYTIFPQCDSSNSQARHGSDSEFWIVGFVNAAPYITIAIFTWWLSDPINHWKGRRFTIFVAALFSLAAPIGSAGAKTWEQLVVCRILLGIGMGLKEVTVPIYTAEIAPAKIRGTLVMLWQIWTTIGQLFGCAANLIAFSYLENGPNNTENNHMLWRLQLGSACIPALPLLAGIFLCPESPRWRFRKGDIQGTYDSFKRLRQHELQAARDLYYIHLQWNYEEDPPNNIETFRRFKKLFSSPNYRRPTIAASVVMASQQLCGINILAFYSTSIFANAQTKCPASGTSAAFTSENSNALSHTLGYAAVNFVFGLFAFRFIDRHGRRTLLLWTIPAMALFILIAGFCFFINEDAVRGPRRLDTLNTVYAMVLIFTALYSPGLGPIPFTYSAEVFPLTHREIGMGWAVAVNNFWGSLLALSFPWIFKTFKPEGSFGFVAALNVLVFVLIFIFVPETKQRPLESFGHFFSIPKFTRKYLEFNVFYRGLYYYRRLIFPNGRFDTDEYIGKPKFDFEELRLIEPRRGYELEDL